MEPSNQEVAEVMNLLKSHSKHSETDSDPKLRTTIFMQVLERLQLEIGLEGARLAIGLASHNVDVPEDQDGFEQGAEVMDTDAINMYSLLIVTPRVIIDAHGHIHRYSQSIEPEPTMPWARRRISQLTMDLGEGDKRATGAVASHPELTLRFEDGRQLPFPGYEEELSREGISALEDVILEIKREVFA